jgi:hypothetical protein
MRMIRLRLARGYRTGGFWDEWYFGWLNGKSRVSQISRLKTCMLGNKAIFSLKSGETRVKRTFFTVTA